MLLGVSDAMQMGLKTQNALFFPSKGKGKGSCSVVSNS